MSKGKNQYVTPHPKGGWQVRGENNTRATVRTETKKEAMDILGNWKSTVTLKNDLASQEDPFVEIASIYVEQTNEFTFNEDGTFSRTVSEKAVKAETFADGITPDQVLEVYRNRDSVAVLKGEYSVNGKKLNLTAKSILFGGKETPYEEYYKSEPALGPASSKAGLFITEEGDLVISGLKFKKM